MTKQYKVLGLIVCLTAAAALFTVTPAQASCDDAYLAYMKTTIHDLDVLYLKSKDEKLSQGEAEIARQAALRKARKAFAYMDRRFDSMKIDEGVVMCPQELHVNVHLMTMMLDMVVSEHLPHEDRWSYTY